MTEVLAARVEALAGAEYWTPFEAAAYLAGDFWGRIPFRESYWGAVRPSFSSPRPFLLRFQALAAALTQRLKTAFESPQGAPAAGVTLYQNPDGTGQRWVDPYCLPNVADVLACKARFPPSAYIDALRGATLNYGENNENTFFIDSVLCVSPFVDTALLERLATLSDAEERLLFEQQESTIFWEYRQARHGEDFATWDSETKEREQQSLSNVITEWPPRPLQAQYFPALTNVLRTGNAPASHSVPQLPAPLEAHLTIEMKTASLDTIDSSAALEEKESAGGPELDNPQETDALEPPNTSAALENIERSQPLDLDHLTMDSKVAPGVYLRDLLALVDPNHPRYAPELARAVQVWASFEREPPSPTRLSTKAQIRSRLSKHGSVCDAELNRLSIVANWVKKGGAPCTVAPKVVSRRKNK